jgi:flavin reductase (DIM6/NTAB) family NADH-FMN oxidoreductase RutF
MNKNKVPTYYISMKFILITLAFFIFISCENVSKKRNEMPTTHSDSIEYLDAKNKSFEEIFQQIDSADIRSRLSQLSIQEDHTVITAGTDSLFNSMAARWEALGLYFGSPNTLNLLGANRFTLELIRKYQSYTLTFLPEQYQSELYAFGRTSGRNSNKMQETELTYVKTPSGNITYKEATVIIECQLFEITTVNTNDFYTKESRDFTVKAYEEVNDYHKLVFGKVTKMWIRKSIINNIAKQKVTDATTTDANSGATYYAASGTSNVQIKQKHQNNFESFLLIPLSLSVLLAYFFTLLLQYKKHITKQIHRKIWNTILFFHLWYLDCWGYI